MWALIILYSSEHPINNIIIITVFRKLRVHLITGKGGLKMDNKNQFDQNAQNNLNQGNPQNHSTKQSLNQGEQLDEDYDTPGTLATYSNRDEETAAELTSQDINDSVTDEEDTDFDIQVNSVVGWVAIALSVISFFWLPILFGAAGIITGFMARNRDANVLGNIAIAGGAIAIILSLFVTPFM